MSRSLSQVLKVSTIIPLAFVCSLFAQEHSEIAHTPEPSLRSNDPLPHCVDQPREVTEIAESVNVNKKKKDLKYKSYMNALQSDSDSELLARLVYAETKAANCADREAEIMPRIAEVISNRVRRRGGNIRSVIFELDQFASSLNIYKESRYRDFLCPSDHELWNHTRQALSSPKGILSSDTFNYYLYKHMPGKTKEPWVLVENTDHTNPPLQSCVRFFHNPTWK